MRPAPVTALCRVHDVVTKVGFQLSGLALVIILFTYWFEVVARYFFSAPTLWGTSIIAYSLCAAICLATPELARTRGHVAISILSDLLPAQLQWILARIVALLSVAVTGGVAYIVWMTMMVQAERGTSTAAWISIPRYWLTALIFYALAGATLYFLRQTFRDETQTQTASAGGVK